MSFRKIGRDEKPGTLGMGLALALALGLGLAGCGADYVTNSQAAVNLLIMAINGGAQLDSDVRNGADSSFVCENEVDVEVAVLNKNPNGVAADVQTVILDSYQVTYARSDGRGTEGIDIPYRITGTLTQAVPVGTNVTFPLEVVRRQAKLEPPLSNIFQTTILTVFADVTLYGKTVSGQLVSASGRLQIDFADFGDTQTTCPTS
jgi:hypothetical protein